MKFLNVIFIIATALFSTQYVEASNSCKLVQASPVNGQYGLPYLTQNSCVSFTVGSGTGCSWMCNYCAQQLGTNNYYFTDGVCKYDSGQGSCVGNPQTGVTYTCCSSSSCSKK
jgi:hypothetical protein